MEHQSSKLNALEERTSLHAPPKSRRGVALVIVLGFLVLLTVLIVAFFTSVTTEYSSTKTYVAGASTQFLADSAVNVVMGQIAKATQGQQTGSATRYTWASQPGMIRTYSDSGSNSEADCFKLYSATSMIAGGGNVTASLAADVPTGWNTMPANFTDLNAPVTVVDPAGNPVQNFPIIDGNVTKVKVNGADVLTYDGDKDHLSDGVPDIEGFGVPLSSVPNYDSASAISATNNPVPMPVQWLYMLKDGTLTAADLPTSGGASKTATFASGTGAAPTATNPIVGRVAFWTDDETCKLNINTATEGQYYAFPHVNTPTDIKSSVKPFSFAITPPASYEYNRYTGHPAATCLSVALGNWIGDRNATAPTAYTTSDSAYLGNLQKYMTLLPRNQFGGSEAGTKPGTGLQKVMLDSDRLFASMDEIIFDPMRTPTPQLTSSAVERLKFFLTASSRAPELTPFNTPKMSLYPQWFQQSHRDLFPLDSQAGSAAEAKAVRTTYSLLRFCSSFGNTGNPWPKDKFEYFFQRYSGRKDDSASNMPSDRNSFDDWDRVPRNQALGNYLYNMGTKPIPGYAGAFVSGNKYSQFNFGSLVVQCLDVIRSNVGRRDYTGSDESYIYPLVVRSGFGASATMPYKGFGEYPVVTQIALGCTPSNDAQKPLLPFLIFNVFAPVQSLPGNNMALSIKGDNLANLGIPGFPSSYTMNPSDWLYNKIPTMRGFSWGLAGYSFDNSGTSVPMGSGGDVVFRPVDQAGNTIQKITVNFPATTVPKPTNKQSMNANTILEDSAGSAVRAVEVDPTTALKGDYRLMGALYDVSKISGKPVFRPVNKYADTSLPQAHHLRLCNYRFPVGSPYESQNKTNLAIDNEPTCADGAACPPGAKTNEMVGSLSSQLVNTDYKGAQAPCVPWGLKSAEMINSRPGDWDTGPGLQPDGPYINPSPQTFTVNEGASVYFASNDVGKDQAGVGFSPNRLIASAVRFGSLPTGVDPVNPKPWQTLLFCPNPAGRQTAIGGVPTAARDHIGFADPPDHVFLEFFTMPVVEPYAISEPLSTAGKVNINYQLAPFTNIERSTALRGVLKNTLMTGISGLDVKGQLYKMTAAYPQAGGTPPASAGTAQETRYEINRDATLAGIKKHFFDSGKIFRYGSEICSIFLVPQRIAGASYLGAPPPTDYDSMMTWWAQPALGANKTKMNLTGDNLREEPYNHIYPRVTTKSNTYTIHYRVQVLQKNPSTKADEWVEGRDVVTAEHRGSTMIERYVDPNDPALDSSWDAKTMTVDPAADLTKLYKFRVINVKQFAP